MTRMMEPTSVRSTSKTEARIVVVRSITMVEVMPGWKHRGEKRQLCLMRSTVSMILAPGCRKMMIKTARVPSM